MRYQISSTTGNVTKYIVAKEQKMRINKYISQSGIASRREADQILSEGRVKLNGSVVYDLAIQVGEKDVVLVDDKEIPKPTGLVYYLFTNQRATSVREKTQKKDQVCMILSMNFLID